MISADNEYMQEAGKTLYTLNGDDRIRDRCEALEDYRRTWEGVKQEMEEKDVAIAEKDAIIAELELSNAELISSNEEKDSLIASLKEQVAGLQQMKSCEDKKD